MSLGEMVLLGHVLMADPEEVEQDDDDTGSCFVRGGGF